MTLDTLPIKTLYKIIETGDSSILGKDHEELWKKLFKEYQELDYNGQSSKLTSLSIRLNKVELRKTLVLLCLEALKFDKDNWVLTTLKELGYEVKKDTYFDDIERHEKGVQGLEHKIKSIKDKFPKKPESKTSIDEVIISYCSILGVSYNTNTVSVVQFYALQDATESKIKNLKNG